MVLGPCCTSTEINLTTPTESTKHSVLPIPSLAVGVTWPLLAHMSRAVVQEQGSIMPGSQEEHA